MAEESQDYRSPRKDDVLFASDTDWKNNAFLHDARGEYHPGYTGGYRRGARILVEYVMEKQWDQDYLVYPILFLYRHHVELALKNILRRVPYLLNRERTPHENGHLGKHRLDLLWQDLRPMLSDGSLGWQPLPKEDIEGIDSYIQQLYRVDPDSFAFRYSQSKDGTPSLPSDLRVINLRRFAELMERLADYLDGLDSVAMHLGEVRSEMNAEWQHDMAEDQGFPDEY